MVIDYAQMMNQVTPLDAYPLHLDLLDQISQYSIFSYIDLKDTFHQFRLKSEERHLTAFEADQKLWEFKTLFHLVSEIAWLPSTEHHTNS